MKKIYSKKYINLLDIGSSKIAVLVVKLLDKQTPSVVGYSCVPSKGIQNGHIWNLEEATQSISEAIRQAEKKSGEAIEEVVVNVSSSDIHSSYIYQEMELDSGKPVSELEVQTLVDKIIQTGVAGEEIIHAFPLRYVIDNEQSKNDPRGIYASKLGAHLHVISVPEVQMMNLMTVLDRCHVTILMKVVTPYASALSVLKDEEKDIGSTVIDFGGGTTSYSIFIEGVLVQLGMVPYGGDAITRSIAEMLNTNISNAERLKILNGAAYATPKDDVERIIVPVLAEEENKQIKKSELINVIIPKLENVLNHVLFSITKSESFSNMTKNFVLVGGGSGLAGIKEKIKSAIEVSVQIGKVKQIKNLPKEFDSCTFGVCVGLLMYVLKRREDKAYESIQSSKLSRTKIGKVVLWIKQALS